jgi:L-ribulose-5-phosphate 3-epimerase
MPIKPYEIGICSWSLQVKSVAELELYCRILGVDLVQIACGDPHHSVWEEGDAMPATALKSNLRMCGSMIAFPNEDYSTPQTIHATGGFGNPATRRERLEIFRRGVDQTRALGLKNLTSHVGFIPYPGNSDRLNFLRNLEEAAKIAGDKNIILSLETGQETAQLLRTTLDELQLPNLKVNFDPANMLLYDMDNPIEALDTLGPYVYSVHLKDAVRPKVPGSWGVEVPLGQGQVNIPKFVQKLKEIGFAGPLIIEREAGDLPGRLHDISAGICLLRECLGINKTSSASFVE